ncbi:L,D-transpeptidase [Consotaella aegiceratis]|uniref:L,D-transpeptidase n=1 Tax=Consotaella aegiceratis TaxID=3097961 RepID=UPI002F42EF79
MRKMPLAVAAVTALLGVQTLGSAQAEEVRRYNPSTARWETVDLSRVRSVRQREPDRQFQRKTVGIETREQPGTIIVDTQRHFLYHVGNGGKATRYGVGVGREGFGWSGDMKIGRKAEWPGWTPPPEMVRRERAKGRNLPAYMAGGPDNPLGARAMYLYRNGHDSMYRIHGTNQPWTIGQNMSSGCIRMMNEDVEDLYDRAGKGTKVVVIGPDGSGRDKIYRETRAANGLLEALFGS